MGRVRPRKWTEREVEILREMMADSYPHAAIAARLGRTVGQIRDKWRTVKDA
jgi:DNA-binding NarL/FixJ family response regulator